MDRFFLVAHTHWDKEWHKTNQENRVRLIGFMEDLLSALESDDSFRCFVLDGQTSLLLDYLDVCPDGESRLRTLIEADRLIIGPWFVQPDVNIPSAEALLRNLLISRSISERFGPFMKVGYLPDSFGMSADLPTLLHSFGIEDALFYRGLSADDVEKDVFLWNGIDGSEVLAAWMPDGYGNAMFLTPDEEDSAKQVADIKAARQKRGVESCFLLMSGSDQCYAKKHLAPLCEKLQRRFDSEESNAQIILCTPSEYLNAVREHRETLEHYKGEMRRGRHSRTHIGISATRMDIKQRNFYIDVTYRHVLEPLCALSAIWGLAYPQALINRGWRYILENHAHDSICCCCTDTVHREMLERISAAEQIADTIIANTWQELHKRIAYDPQKGRPLLLFSSYPGERRELVQVTVYVKSMPFSLVDNSGTELPYTVLSTSDFNLKDTKVSLSPIPDDFYQKVSIAFYAESQGLGYTSYYIREGTAPLSAPPKGMVRDGVLENSFLRCTVEQDGTLKIFDKLSNQEYGGQHLFMDGGNAGDEYDFSPPWNDTIIDSRGAITKMEILADTPLCASIGLSYRMLIPETCDNQRRTEQTIPIDISCKISLGKEDRFIDIETIVLNSAKNHRVQVVFDLGEKIDTHIADVQLGELLRENESNLTAESETDGWSERYYPVYTQQKYAALPVGDGGLLVMNRGIPQYEILQGTSTRLAMTLLSCVGVMGNEKLKYRPGRRSGAVCETPDSQMQGEWTFRYRLACLAPDLNRFAMAEQFCNPVVGISYPEYDGGFLPDEFYAIRHDGTFVLKAFKRAEHDESLIARFANPKLDAATEEEITIPPFLFSACELVDSAENPTENKGVHIGLTTNPDASDPYLFSGKIEISHAEPHALFSVAFRR